MRDLRIAREAASEIEQLLTHSAATFGPAARRRYEQLIAVALNEIRRDPMLPGSAARDDLRAGLRAFHLSHARAKARRGGRTVLRPRHFIIYRVPDEKAVDIIRVLHDAMDLSDHIAAVDD
jgi:toxin ParE1/3/4